MVGVVYGTTALCETPTVVFTVFMSHGGNSWALAWFIDMYVVFMRHFTCV